MKKSKLISLLLAAVIGAGSLAMTAQAAPAGLPEQTAKTATFAKTSEWAQDDWTIFALGRNQETGCETLYEEYYQGVLEQLADPEANLISSDYIRISLALTAIGIDPRNINGNNLLEKIDQGNRQEYLQMSTGSLAYSLALMERYPDSFTGTIKEETVQQILAAQQADGSFEYMAGAGFSDPDSTAQAMQGLLLLGDTYAAEIQGAADWLTAQMDENGVLAIDWGTGPSPNPSSTAQALIAFSQKGEEPANAQGKTFYDGMMGFALDDGSFQDANWATEDPDDLIYDAYASGQCFQGLVAYNRMAKNQTALFDLSDVTVTPRPKPDEKPESGSSSQASSQPSSVSSEESKPAASSKADDLDTPKTGDMGLAAIAVMGLVAAAAATVLYKKK